MLPAMRACLLILLWSLVPGCYLAHEIEGSPVRPPPDGGRFDSSRPDASRPDTGIVPRPDAAPGVGDYWTLERRDSQLGIAHALGCTQYEGGRIALEVATTIENICEFSGPVDTTVDAEGTLRVTAYLWVHHIEDPAACSGVTALSRRTLLLQANEGTFRAVSDDGSSSVELLVGAIDDLPCTFAGDRDAPCRQDCECRDGLMCIPQLGDFVICEGGHCGDPCELQAGTLRPVYGQDLECDPSEQCRSGAALGAPVCQPIEGDGCEAGDCGQGLICPPTGIASECVWDIRLNGMNRHPCGGDADCDAGLFCVEHRDGERRCEVPCFSNEMRCPIMHICDSTRWVCEWLGE